ncbi:MAG: signal peptide peptidase SppA [Bacteroidota bacterium]
MNSSTKWLLIIAGIVVLVGGLIITVVFFTFSPRPEYEDVTVGFGDKIAVVELNGVIVSSEQVVRQLKKYREDSSVKGILLRIDSPGGGVVASHEMYDEVRKTKASGKPIVASMGSVAASGGYYVAVGADKIVANPGTLTGSIGVISEFLRIDPLLNKIGVEANTIKSGKLKDAGNPFRAMTADDKKYFQNLMDEVHRQFISIVEKERKLDHDSIVSYADGRVFTGTTAYKMHLVDTLGTYEDAIAITARMAGIKGTPAIVREGRPLHGLLDLLLGETRMSGLENLKEELLNRPILQYKIATGF